MIASGLLSIWVANRITSTIRPRGTLDLVGPDRYMQGLAVVLIVLGTGLLIKGFRDYARRDVPEHRSRAVESRQGLHWALVAILIAYTALLAVLGYPLATLMAFLALFWIMGIRTWFKTCVASLIATATFYVLFIVIAGMDFPKGMLGLG